MFTLAFLMNVLPVADSSGDRGEEEEEEELFVVLGCLESRRRVTYSCGKCCD